MRITIVGVLTILIVTLLSGCWDQKEAERMLYAHGVGIDFEDGQYIVYLQIINFASVAKSENPTSPDITQSEVGRATGKTMEEAFVNLYKSVDEEIYWGHLTYIVFSEEALKNKRLNPVIDSFIRYIETRYRIWIYSTKDAVKDVLLIVPIINTSITISKLDDPLNAYEQDSYIHPLNIRELIIGLNEPNHEIVIPFVTVTQNWESAKDSSGKASINGGSILSPESFKGTLTGDKLNGLQWMNRKSIEGEVSFSIDNNDEQSHASVIIQDVNVKVSPIVEGNDVKFDIDISVVALGSIIPPKAKMKDMKDGVMETIEQEVKKTYKEALERDADIYRLSEHVYRKNNKAWKELQTDGKIELTEDSIRSLNVKIRKFKSGRKSLSNTFK